MAGFGDPHMETVDASGLKLGIVGSRWHSDLVDHMIARAEAAAKECGADEVYVARVARPTPWRRAAVAMVVHDMKAP